jgi:hypothetical protein
MPELRLKTALAKEIETLIDAWVAGVWANVLG